MVAPGVDRALQELRRYLEWLEQSGMERAEIVTVAQAVRAKLEGLEVRLDRLVHCAGRSSGHPVEQGQSVWEKATCTGGGNGTATQSMLTSPAPGSPGRQQENPAAPPETGD